MIALNDAFQPEAGRVTDAERRALTDPDVIEETRRLRALGLGPVEALRIAARSVRNPIVPAGRVALASPAQSPPSYSEWCAPAGASPVEAHGCWDEHLSQGRSVEAEASSGYAATVAVAAAVLAGLVACLVAAWWWAF